MNGGLDQTDREHIAVIARDTLDALNETVPSNVAHYAIEDARHALEKLARVMDTERVRDLIKEGANR